jgi:poly-gamma-glutamate synthesis protein (capsule biosynthesis protein)
MYRLLVVGDLMVGTENKEPGNCSISSVKKLMKCIKAHAALGNLEVPLTERGFPSDKLLAWRSPPATAESIREMGFKALALATNHTMDYGNEGLFDTIGALDKTEIQRTGAGPTLNKAMTPALLPVDSYHEIAIVSISCTLPANSAAGESRPGIVPIHVHTAYEIDINRLQERPGYPPCISTKAYDEDVKRICKLVSNMKEQGYTVVTCIHWGVPFQKHLAEYQRPIAKALINSGCDVVIGSHPHTIHAIELIEQAPVLYSIGNFIVSRELMGLATRVVPESTLKTWHMSADALVGVLEFEAGKFARIELWPITIHNGLPKLAKTRDSHRILKETKALSAKFLPWDIHDGVAGLEIKKT